MSSALLSTRDEGSGLKGSAHEDRRNQHPTANRRPDIPARLKPNLPGNPTRSSATTLSEDFERARQSYLNRGAAPLATLGWVHWHNSQRLHAHLGNTPQFENATSRDRSRRCGGSWSGAERADGNDGYSVVTGVGVVAERGHDEQAGGLPNRRFAMISISNLQYSEVQPWLTLAPKQQVARSIPVSGSDSCSINVL